MVQFDCHAHVYEKVTSVAGARYIPQSPAPLATWKKNLSGHNLKGGVIVQVSFHGTDNFELCAALSQLDKARFAGVGVVDLDVDELELDQLVEAGIKGFRWNLVRGKKVPDVASPIVQAFLQKLRQRGLHLEVHLEGPRLAPHLNALSNQGVNLVIDHFGLPSDPNPDTDPFITAVKHLHSFDNLYLKFSAHYRTDFPIDRHAQELLTTLGCDRVVWGSDWPHTQHEDSASYSDTLGAAMPAGCISDVAAAKILYGITAS